MLKRLGAGILVASAVYFPAFWNHGGTIGQPARALHSAISPDARDLQSNQYRRLENANLILNIQQSKSMGKGFGVPINYDIPMTDLRGTDSFIAYVPHDGVLYIWMRLGFVGEIVFMAMIAAAIIRASQLTKVADKELALFGSLVVCAVVAYLVQGYNDMGFFWFRIALCMGILLGAVEAALRLAPTRESTPVAAP
jgi:O-antigen ligase